MPIARTNFKLNYESVERIQDAIRRCGSSSEQVINDYLHNEGGTWMQKHVTQFMPVSNRKERQNKHAKFHKWYDQSNYNMAVAISNKTSGKRGNSYYYLYYLATGHVKSRQADGNEFMEKGLEKSSTQIVNDLVNRMLENVNKELK